MNEKGTVPILRPGQPAPRLGGELAALMRHLDEDGTARAGRVMVDRNGQKVALPLREQYVDAEELVQMIADEVERRVVALLDSRTPAA